MSDSKPKRARRGKRKAARGTSDAEGREKCDVCGRDLREIHCTLVCPTCGATRDCSDP